MHETSENEWTTVISSRRGWFELNLRELWQYRDLIMLFVRRDFVTIYKQTVLGPFWFVLQPLVSMLIFIIVFGRIIGITTDGVPQTLFYLSGIVTWNYFAACLTRTSDILVANAGIFGKVYFPRLAVPVSIVVVNLVTFMIQFALFCSFLCYYWLINPLVRPTLFVLLTPFLIIQMAALGLGIGILVSSLTTKYRDLAFLTGFAVQLWMYATPIVYPLSKVPEGWKWLFALNPMTSIVETFRRAFLGSGVVEGWRMGLSVLITAALMVVAVCAFNRVEKTFVDTV